jgi:hypothetical protein
MEKRYRYLIIGLVVVCVAVIAILVATCAGPDIALPLPPTHTPTPTESPTPTVSVPQTPVNLTAKAESGKTLVLNWLDNSSNEEGFILYRDSVEITRTGPNASTYQDINLKPATTYQYSVKAFNKAGESGTSTFIVKTPNPSITIRLDRIGVYDNRENVLRGESGEVYLYVAVSDGKNPVQQLRFPREKNDEYKLAKNETVDIGSQIFYASEVGDYLTLTVIGYERDGEGFEPLVYKALAAAINAQAGGAIGTILDIFNLNLADLLGQLLGEADDFLGSYENTWDVTTNWGTGQYTDLVCKDERGIDCLRLWFTITSE